MGLKPSLEIDPITNLPSLSVNTSNTRTHLQWQDIFTTIRTEIAPHYPTLLIFDEFQDIAFIPGIQGEMRQVLEAFRDVPIIILGSKQHILSRIFAQPNAPLAGFGEDLEFKPIPYEEYTEYMNERFAERDLKIGADDSQKLQDLLLRVPEPINITCADLMSRLSDKTIAWQDVAEAIVRVIEGRHTRFERMLSLFSQKEEEVLTAIGKFGPIKYVTGKDFLKRVNCSARAAKTITEKLLDRSFLDKTADGYRVADPLLALFMQRYR